MTYYDELLLEPTASIDDIQTSYRRVTKLLHPDRHADPLLQALAEAQMKRLNAIIAVLTDPVQRHTYDAGLLRNAIAVPLSVIRLRQAYSLLSSATLLASGVLAGLLLSYYGQPADPERRAATPAGPPQNVAGTLLDNAQQRSHKPPDPAPEAKAPALPAQLRKIPDALADAAAAAADAGLVTGNRREPAAEVPGVAAAVGSASGGMEAERSASPLSGRYAGAWFYAPLKIRPADTLYTPEYIEMRVSEQEGAIRGVYRARYRIPDKPIPPDVVFEFEGRSGGSEPVFHWTGLHGAHGMVKLKALSDASLEVSWYVTQFSPDMALGAGTAILIRRAD